MSRLRHLAAALTLGLCPLLAPLARAWTFTYAEPWPDGPVPIAFGVTPAMPTNLPPADWENALRTAAAAWNGSLQRIQLDVRPTTDTAWYENGENEVFFDKDMFDDPFPSGVLAVTAYTHDRGARVETDIVVNRSWTWSVYPGQIRSNPVDLRRVLIHELGHFLGLDHPDQDGQSVTAIMNSSVSNVEALTADDQGGARALYDFGPGVAPIVIVEPKDTTAKQGAAAALGVLAGGRGPFRYEWSRNGVPIPGATAATLTLAAARLEEAGDYRVTVSNGAGNIVSRTVRLGVTPAQAPQVELASGGAEVPAGRDFLFVATVTGDEPLRYEWRKNGVLLPGESRRQLTLKDVQLSDAGDYAVTVSNVAGSRTVSRSFKVLPPEPLRFLSSFAGVAVAGGQSFTLTAPVGNLAAVSFQWQKNGVDIPGAIQRDFTIGSSRPEDAGQSSVIIRNSFGQLASNVAEVSFFGAAGLTIARQPAAVSALAGEAAVFSVGLDVPVTTFRWFKDGVPVPARNPGGFHLGNLSVPSVGPADEGIYSVEVGDGQRTVRSHGARLTVLRNLPLRITRHPAAHTVVEGASVSLSVAAGPSTMLSYRWLKDGAIIPINGQATYEFAAKAGDAGRYRAQVLLGDVVMLESDEVEVQIVPTARRFAAHPASRIIDPNAADTLTDAVADEVARRRAERAGEVYTYAVNGQPVPSPYVTRSPFPVTYTLTIGPAGAPETSRPFHISFGPPAPIITRHPSGGTILAYTTVSLGFEANVAGGNYQWYRNGEILPEQQGRFLSILNFTTKDVGDYTVAVSNAAGRAVSEPARLEIQGGDSPIIRLQPRSMTVSMDSSAPLSVATRPGTFQFQWYRDEQPLQGWTSSNYTVSTTFGLGAGAYHVVVTDGTVSERSQTAYVRVLARNRVPEIVAQPANATVLQGGDATFAASVDGEPVPDRYQWYKNGVAIPGATDAKLRLSSVQPAAAGAYTVVISSASGSVTSAAGTLTVDERSRLINLATRARVGRGDDVMIAGFTISGTESRQVLVRAIGDQLSEFGVSGVLRDPVLKIFDGKGKELASNDDWFRTSDEKTAELAEAARQVGAFAQRNGARDAALLQTLSPGSYTAQVSGLVNTTGVGLVEIYELGKPGKGRLINLSSRAVVGTGANILIPGLVLQGSAPRRLLIRAVGPGLATLGVARALVDPQLKVLRSDGATVGENDNWGQQAGAASTSAIASATTAVGGFPLTAGSRDAAVLLDLPAGSYTIQVSGVNNTEGIALVEVYEVP